MTDFFGGLDSGNIRFTDSRINGGGPLPTSLSGPEGINGNPDGRYNFNDSLLSGIAPYAGPKSGRMGSDRNYQNIPHRKQYPVPKIFLPESAWDTNETFDMSHPIDMGDVAFNIVMNHKQYILTNYNAFANICTNFLIPDFDSVNHLNCHNILCHISILISLLVHKLTESKSGIRKFGIQNRNPESHVCRDRL
jgi:hypothetical protein